MEVSKKSNYLLNPHFCHTVCMCKWISQLGQMAYGSGPNLGQNSASASWWNWQEGHWLVGEWRMEWLDWLLGSWLPCDCEAASETDTSLRTDGNLVQASCVSIEVAPSGVLHPHPHQSNLLASASQYTLVRLHGWLPWNTRAWQRAQSAFFSLHSPTFIPSIKRCPARAALRKHH